MCGIFGCLIKSNDNNTIKIVKIIYNALSLLKNNFDVRYNDELELVTIRHYNTETIESICAGKTVIIEQKTRYTARFVLKAAN